MSNDQNELITIAKFNDLPEAELASSILNEHGVYNFLANKNFIGANFLMSYATGGIALQVHKKDIELALQLLNTNKAQNEQALSEIYPKEDEEKCPNCGSTELTFKDSSKKASAFSLILNFPFLFMKKRIVCNKCKKEIK